MSYDFSRRGGLAHKMDSNFSMLGGSVYISAIPILKIGNSAASAASPRLLHYCLKIQNPKILKH